jgi:hypothetical protein
MNSLLNNTVKLSIEVAPAVEKKAEQMARESGLTLSQFFERMILQQSAPQGADENAE